MTITATATNVIKLRPNQSITLSGNGVADQFIGFGGYDQFSQVNMNPMRKPITFGPAGPNGASLRVSPGLAYEVTFPKRDAEVTGSQFVSGATLIIAQRSIMALFGDSLMGRTERTISVNQAVAYNPATGLLTITAAGHGGYTGALVHIANDQGEIYDATGAALTPLTMTRVDANTLTVPIGAGLTPNLAASWYLCFPSCLSEETFYCFLTVPRPQKVSYGAPGASTVGMLSQLDAVVNSPAKIVAMRGGTNDQAKLVPLATTIANIRTMVAAITQAGKVLILFAPAPINTTQSSGYFMSNLRNAIVQIARSTKNVYLVDEHAIAVDTASAVAAAKANYLQADNTHYTPLLNKQVAAKVQNILDRLGVSAEQTSHMPDSALSGYDATNNPTGTGAFSNPILLTATGGTNNGDTTIAGVIAGGMRVDAAKGSGSTWTVGSVVASVVAADDGIGKAQQIVCTPSVNNDAVVIGTRGTDNGAAQAAGMKPDEWRKGVLHLKMTGLTGQAVLKFATVRVTIVTADGSFATIIQDHNGTWSVAQQNQTDFDLDFETGEFPVPAGIVGAYVDAQIFFAAASASPITIKVSRIDIPLVRN